MRLAFGGVVAFVVIVSGACSSSSPSGGTAPIVDAGTSTDSGVTAACPAPTSGPTTHTTAISADETWTAATSPHVVPDDLTVSAKLTIEPCAEVLINGAKQIAIANGGTIVARGTATQPIHIGVNTFDILDKSAPFASISGSGGSLELAYATLDGGGDPGNAVANSTGLINLQGTDNSKPTQGVLFVDHVQINGSKSNGIVLRDGAGFEAGSGALTITGSAEFPVSIWSRAVDTLPSGTYTGNATDEILLPASAGNESIHESATMHAVGVPYRVGDANSKGTLYVSGGAAGLSTLTIEAGVTLRFAAGGVLYVEPSTGTNPATGALIAKGTAANPITFTSAATAPAAGDWLGVYFGQIPDASDAIDQAKIEFAGGTSGVGSDACPPTSGTLDAAVRFFGVVGSELVTNTAITSSKANGFDRGYRSDTKQDVLATNTFTTVATCNETYPKDANGMCPATVPCPK